MNIYVLRQAGERKMKLVIDVKVEVQMQVHYI